MQQDSGNNQSCIQRQVETVCTLSDVNSIFDHSSVFRLVYN